MANEQIFIKLKTAKKAECGNPFAVDSTFQAMVKASKYNPEWELLPMDAKDLQGRPYDGGIGKLYSFILKDGEYEVVKQASMKRVAWGFPNSNIEDDNEPLDLGLNDVYSEKEYLIDRDGFVTSKTAGKEEEEKEDDKEMDGDCEGKEKEASKKTAESQPNMLTDSKDNISTKFDGKPAGADDPAVSDSSYKADESEKPATFPILGTQAKSFVKDVNTKTAEIRKKLGITEPNNQTDANDISIDFNTAVDGSGTVDKGAYSADESEKPWKDENLGQVSANQKKTAEEKVIKAMPADGNSGGSNLDDFSIDNNVEEGSKDEFRPKEAKNKTANTGINMPVGNEHLREDVSNAVDPMPNDENDWLDEGALGLTDKEKEEAYHGLDEKPLY